MADLLSLFQQHPGPMVADGAMGSLLLKRLPDKARWDGKYGCCEWLNLHVPTIVSDIHTAYLNAGANIVTTNTFCGSALMLKAHGLEDRTREINIAAARLAREAIISADLDHEQLVAGSIGPGTVWRPDAETPFGRILDSYREQAIGLVQGGVDLLLVETARSLMQIEAALRACTDVALDSGAATPVAVTIQPESNAGNVLDGSAADIAELCERFDVIALGVNCGTGPASLSMALRSLIPNFHGPIIVRPSAGIPGVVGANAVYPVDERQWVDECVAIVRELSPAIVGGCCGTTPEYIAPLVQRLEL